MTNRELGRSGLRVSRLGLGLAALGRPGYINVGHAQDLGGATTVDSLRLHAHTVLDSAWEWGIRYFDTARSYGMGEEFLGSWLRSRNRSAEAATVASKWGYRYTAGWRVDAEVHEIKEHSLAMLQRQWQETAEHLQGQLDLYQIHSATLESGVLDNVAVLGELTRLREQGTRIGLSVSGAEQAAVIRRALEIEVDGIPLFDAVQATWNLLERSAEGALADAHAAGRGVIVKEALANGRLTARGSPARIGAQPEVLQREAKRLGTTPDALALGAVLARPWADVVLCGAATPEHLASNIGALALEIDDMLAARLAELTEPPHQYWATRAMLPWT